VPRWASKAGAAQSIARLIVPVNKSLRITLIRRFPQTEVAFLLAGTLEGQTFPDKLAPGREMSFSSSSYRQIRIGMMM
jgi:hypothetical protein